MSDALEKRLERAMVAEYAAGWPYYDKPTRRRLGEEAARLNIDAVLAAIRRAGLKLTEANDD